MRPDIGFGAALIESENTPCSSKVSCLLDDFQVGHPSFDEPDCNQLSSISSTDDHDVDLLVDGTPVKAWLDPRVLQVVRERTIHFDKSILVNAPA
jgi:hypothetical protein